MGKIELFATFADTFDLAIWLIGWELDRVNAVFSKGFLFFFRRGLFSDGGESLLVMYFIMIVVGLGRNEIGLVYGIAGSEGEVYSLAEDCFMFWER